MGRVTDQRVGFVASRMPRNAGAAQPDFDLLLLDHNFDDLSNMPIRHAISDGVDIHKTISVAPAFQTAGADRQQARRQGSQSLSLIAIEPHSGLLLGRAVNPAISDLDHPTRQMALQFLKGGERSPGEGIVLDIAYAPLDLPFGSSATRTTRSGCQVPVAAEDLKARIPHYPAGLAVVGGDKGRSVVAENLLGNATEMPECSVEAFEPIILPLRESL